MYSASIASWAVPTHVYNTRRKKSKRLKIFFKNLSARTKQNRSRRPRRANSLEEKPAEVTLERDDEMKDDEITKTTMDDCAQCVKKISDRLPSSREVNETKGSSFWNTFSVAFKCLTAEATPVLSPERIRPLYVIAKQPHKMFLFKEQSNQIKEDQEAVIEATEMQMKEDVDALKNEWSKLLPKISGRGAVFSEIPHQGLSLESEEIDKERSLLACPNRTPTLKSHHRHNHSKPSSGDDDLRDSYMSTDRSASFQRNFRASLFGLEDEVSVAPKQCSSGERLFLGGNGGGDHFKDLQREGSSYVIDALWTSPSRNIMRRLLSTETSLSCF